MHAPLLRTAERHQLQCLYLTRLRRLVDLRRSWDPSWTLADWRLVNQALYSTSRDCERGGLRMVARAVVAGLRR
jgi:hypothetical protein